MSLRPLVDYFVMNNLMVLTSDKEGHFVVMTDHMYAQKTKLALAKSFRVIEVEAKNLRQRALDFLDDVGLKDVAKKVKEAPKLTLEVFYAVKTHKPQAPLRTIVSERNAWLSSKAPGAIMC